MSTTSFFGSTTTRALRVCASCTRADPFRRVRSLAGDGDLIVQPPELQLFPGPEVTGSGADALIFPGRQPALRHEAPQLDWSSARSASRS